MATTELTIMPLITFEFDHNGDLIGIEFDEGDSMCDIGTVIHGDHIEEIDSSSRPAFIEFVDEWCRNNRSTIVRMR